MLGCGGEETQSGRLEDKALKDQRDLKDSKKGEEAVLKEPEAPKPEPMPEARKMVMRHWSKHASV